MIIAIATTATIAVALAASLRSGRRMIAPHGYNNRYTDATAARRDHLG
jgi:hypothetical protein